MSSPLLHLPPHLIPEILSYLPVKDLLRFKSVSSSWRSFIDSSYFTKLHLSRSQKTRSNLLLLFRDHHGFFTLLDFSSLENVPDLKQTPPVLSNSLYSTKIAGTCNGLVVLSSKYKNLYFEKRILSLWNPSTGKFRQLPSPEVPKPEESRLLSITYGFGYDNEKDDYKLVQCAYFRETAVVVSRTDDFSTDFSLSAVFSLKTNIWRPIHCPFYDVTFCEPSKTQVNNASHWLFSPEIVAFDLVKEEYYVVPSPECSYASYPTCLSVLGGCLAMAFHPDADDCVHVWVMNNYGVKESWYKLFSLWLTPHPSYGKIIAVPIAYSRDGEKVLLDYCFRQLLWYDPVRKTVEFVETDDVEIKSPFMCEGSLVWPEDA